MKSTGSILAVFLMLVVTALPGCGSKKDKAAQAPSQKAASTPAPQSGGTVVAEPQDEADVIPVKTRILALVKAGDYKSIYHAASAGFRAVGPEEQFLAVWKKQMDETGAFKGAKEISHTVRPQDKFLLFTYDVEYEKKHKALRLTFGRSKKGVMELTGINQKELEAAGK